MMSLVFATTFFFFFGGGGGGGGGGVLRHSAVQTDFEFEISGPLTTIASYFSFEPRCEKTGLRGFRPGPTQTRLYSHRRWLEA